ncbi:VOC family protein [Chondrinema litorale]|uniref:VOC family protein n=1 Tax=Chondrinema litorale TaxID=2994555 RepID=UPI0025433EA5|nr:VOC family protein [Chondrinema litorale]UZR97795.1 VOC family protein [Chondrinema litorale]
MENQSKILATRYVLAVQNLEKSAIYYQEKLGFQSLWNGEGWHFLKRESFVVMLGECADDKSAFETSNHSYFAYVEVSGIDDLYKEFVVNDVEILTKPEDKPWSQREFAIRTIDGHRIMFGQAL